MTTYLSQQELEVMMSTPERRFTVPVGLATKLGVYGASVLYIASLVTAVLNGDHTPETLTTLATATIVLATTIYGRMKQAAAVFQSAPSPLQGTLEAVSVLNAPLESGPGADPEGPPMGGRKIG